MRDKHPYLVYDSIPYDEASDLFPVSSLPTDAVVRNANAEELIEATPDEAIIAVAPVSMATGYALAQEPLTAVKLSQLSGTGALPVPMGEYELLVRGRPQTRHNHSLSEYA
ncbi:hypothetical protein SAMN05192561_10571 [Halopenitus malekzadehii]|uniref:DUF8165 domain-containing protein n=1 Tax=Halopenitus malekzadehii TaxID=1267564 RepID=A0A1H6J3V7_9EURY|nr:hypothetical protein [Halopenitus malekzadehii]SEH53582.1 hypothetical protein SAMN05192561_10571 [Halopenitus malekzadehii]